MEQIPIRLNHLSAEKHFGNCEYKWKLISASPLKIQKLATQMDFRLRQGDGKAIYILGVKDNGFDTGMSKEELEETFNTVLKAAKIIGANIMRTRTYLRNVTTIRLLKLNSKNLL
tara:strand:+ start:361 stop:705 length:345 start_codon:yes stop_codon:yes gene_type:complete